jgi:hypothetical protein
VRRSSRSIASRSATFCCRSCRTWPQGADPARRRATTWAILARLRPSRRARGCRAFCRATVWYDRDGSMRGLPHSPTRGGGSHLSRLSLEVRRVLHRSGRYQRLTPRHAPLGAAGAAQKGSCHVQTVLSTSLGNEGHRLDVCRRRAPTGGSALAVKPTNPCDPLHKDGVARQPSTGIIWICK